MSLPSLFLQEATSNGDLAVTKLPQDMDLWAETIISKVKEKLPSSRDFLLKVSFTQKNEELGTATGAVTIFSQKLNKAIYIPLIVKNFGLKPLDVILIPKKSVEDGFEIIPLTRDNFNEALFDADVFTNLERTMDRMQEMYLNPQNTVVFPPHFRNVYASAQVLDAINPTISRADRDNFIQYLKNNHNILVGYEKRANLDVLKKVASFSDEHPISNGDEEFAKSNIALIKKDSMGNLRICRTTDEVFDPIIQDIDKVRAIEELSKIVENPEEVMNEVRRNGEYIVFNDLKPKEDAMVTYLHNPGNYTDTQEKPAPVTSFGSYKVMDKNGVSYKGIVLPNVINFDQKVLGTKIFYRQGRCAYQHTMAGVPTQAEPTQFLNFRFPELGMTGTFVTHNNKNAVATIPITIRSVMEDCGTVRIIAEDINGRKVKIKWRAYYNGPMSAAGEENPEDETFGEEPGQLLEIVKAKDCYIVPQRFGFLPLEGFCDIMENSNSFSLKVASYVTDAAPVRVICTGESQFSIKNPDIEKMASSLGWDKTNLSSYQTVFLLTAKQCPLTKVAEALKTAGSRGEAAIHHLGKTQFASEKKASFKSKYDSYIKGLRVNLIKEASALDDSQIVDVALSLNFINSDNVDKFIGFIPYLEECSKVLAQTLLASRLGMTEIPEHSTQTAMYKIVEVVNGLKKLKSDTQER